MVQLLPRFSRMDEAEPLPAAEPHLLRGNLPTKWDLWMTDRPRLAEIEAAAQRIEPYIHRTPVLTCSTFDRMLGGELFFKCENFQKAGAFKFRGACNAVFGLAEEEASRGVVTHSSGNHAGALALAGKLRGIRVDVVMPRTAPKVKQAAVAGYGAHITLCEPTLEARETTTQRIIEKTGATLIHPFDDNRIIAGQGTAALELLQQVKELDLILAPVGGGGLLSGTAIAAKEMCPAIQVVACEPANADDAFRSKRAGRIMPVERTDTIADGLLTSLGDRTFPVIRELVDEIVLVSEEEIRAALRLVMERMKIVIEPSSAVPFAAVLARKIPVTSRRVGIILSGGNIDLAAIPL